MFQRLLGIDELLNLQDLWLGFEGNLSWYDQRQGYEVVNELADYGFVV